MEARKGARYRCFGDGLCCTDIHAIGALTRSEVRRLNLLFPGEVHRNEQLGEMVVTPHGGGCAHLGEDGCRIHATYGPAAKPFVCRRFPYRAIATPDGKRISTEHRCPCRTMGERPALDLEDARISTRGSYDIKVQDIELAPGERVPFATYRAIENEMIDRLLSSDGPKGVLGVEPFPALDTATWTDVAHHYRSKLDGSSCGDALAWFGDVILALNGTRVRDRQRPWSPAFDRAEARSPVADDPARVIADWLADELWGLEWTERGSLLHARLDLATRLVVVREVARRLEASAVRSDRAAAEAVLVGEMAGAAPLWQSVVNAFVLPPRDPAGSR
ncbi:MAG: YkgJ family cysteine cluster protein [Polyangiales bacterium]